MAKERLPAESAADQPTLPTPPSGSGTDPKTATLLAETAEKVGGTIGPYKLLDELGEGGMGTVYLAEQERPVRRRVALKVIKAGLDTAQVIARFEAERQALALMDHPNIARVVDAGATSSGRPFFVMELVQGVPITSYCDAHRVPLRARLAIFLPICRAVQHAHQKGIIHRDLKPSNILITMRDDQPVPKIIDFGIAKATTQRLTERTLYTQHGHLVGTPDYMSPEQAGLGGLDVDTRSDVYSLGAMLYELLCGETPLGHRQLRELDFVTMLNTIYEADPPPPSRRLSELGEKITDVARRRDIEPHRLRQSLHGELDWIVTKALEKERTRRYESPSALAADLERYLNNQPVEAGPPSATYRARKFVRRNRVALSAAAAIAVVLLAATAVSMWQAYRATRAESDMADERRAALVAKGHAEKLLKDVQESEKLAENRRIEAENAKQLADERGTQLAAALAKANQSADNERKARDEIERRLREADAVRLAMNSKESRQRYPQRALLLAAEAVQTTRRKNEPIRSEAHQALREALDSIGGRPLSAHQSAVSFMGLTPNGRWLFTGDGRSVRRWDLAAENPAEANTLIGTAGLNHRAMAISSDGRRLATFSQATNPQKVNLWELSSERFGRPIRELELATQDYINEAAFSADSRWLVASSYQTAWLWDLTADPSNAKPTILSKDNSQFTNVAISANSAWAVTRDSAGMSSLWNLANRDVSPTPRRLTAEGGGHARSSLSPDGRWLLLSNRSSRSDSWTRIWDLNAADPFESPRQIPLQGSPLHGDLVSHFLPQGNLVATATGDNISIWDLSAETRDSPKIRLSFRDSASHDDRGERGDVDFYVQTVMTDRDGRWLLAVDQTGMIHRWDLQATNPQATRFVVGQHPGGGGVTLTISSSGRWLVSSRAEDPPRLWDLWSRSPRTTELALVGHDSFPFTSVQAALGGAKLSAYIASPERIRPIPFAGLGRHVGATLGLGERWLVTRGSDATLRLWDLSAGDPPRAGVRAGRFRLDRGGNDMALRDDGRWLIGSGTNLQIVNPDAADPVEGSLIIRPGTSGLGWSSRDQPLSRNGRWLALRLGRRISVFDLAGEEIAGASKLARKASPATANDNKNGQNSALWQSAVAGGKWLEAFLNQGVDMDQMTTPGAHRPHKVIEHDTNVSTEAVIISPNGQWLLTQDGVRARLWDLRGAGRVARSTELDGHIRQALFSSDGRWLTALHRTQSGTSLSHWNLSADPPQRTDHDLGRVYVGDDALAVSDDGRWMAVGANGLLLWSIADDGTFGKPQVLNTDLRTVLSVTLSRDGTYVAASEGQTLHLWRRGASDAVVGHEVLRGHEQAIHRTAFSPDGAWLVAASYDGDIRLWDLREEHAQDTMITLAVDNQRSQYFGLQRFVFSKDGRWLAATTHSGVYFWQLDPVPLLDEARRLAGRELSADELARYRLNTQDVQRERLLRQADEVSRQLATNPQDVTLLRRRADLLACAGSLQEASDDLRLVARQSPNDHWPQYNLLPLLAQMGQQSAYHAASDNLAKQFAETQQIEIYERIAKGSLFWADSGGDWNTARARADRALEKAIKEKHWVLPWAQIAKGLSEYRLGNHTAALAWAEKGMSNPAQLGVYSIGVPGNQVRAMALAQLGQLDKAKQALAAARKLHDTFPKPIDGWIDGWHDWYMYDMLFNEAEALLLAKSPPATEIQAKAAP